MCWKCTCTSVCDTTGDLRTRSCVAMRVSAGEKRFFRCVNARLQERLPSARRGSVTGRACRAERIMFGEQTTESGAVAVSPPWVGNGSRLQSRANNVRRTPTAESRAVAVSPPWVGNGSRLQSGANNVRRTPTAESRAAGVSPPWVGSGSRLQSGANNVRRTDHRIRSGGRQPAVVLWYERCR
jgi:hypothetical protein